MSNPRSGAILAILVWVLWVPMMVKAQQIKIETTAEGDLITVMASAEMQVDPRTVWSVISDYDRLAEFIPDMRSSRVIRRDGDQLLVEQVGVFGVLFLHRHVEVKLAVAESPPVRIVARAVAGDFREFDGAYEVENLPSGVVRLTYSGRLVPDFPIPPFIGGIVVRSVLAKQFTAMVKEIQRRDALARGASQTR